MKTSKIPPFLFVLLLTAVSLNSQAQKAVLYNFDFRVPDGFRHEIQEYDEKGRKKYRDAAPGDSEYKPDKNVKVLNKYLEPVSKDEVVAICESAAEMLKRKYGYKEVTMIYPTIVSEGEGGGKLGSFPNKGFKNASKKSKADAYITMGIKIADKATLGAKNRSLYWEESGKERTIFMDVTFSYTIYNAQEGIIDQKEISLKEELDPLFNENYNTEIVDSGFKLRKLYLTKEEILSIYKLAEKKLDAAE